MHDYEPYPVEDCHSFLQFVSRVEELHGDKIAFLSDRGGITYGEMVAAIYAVASRLNAMKESRCHLSALNPYYYAVSFFAAVLAGKMALLCDKAHENIVQCGVDSVEVDDGFVREQLQRGESKRKLVYNFETDSPAIVALSSGTTGHTKGVMLSQHNVLSDMVAGMRHYEYAPNSRYMHIIPYTHMFGIVADLLGPLYSGGTICCPSSPFSFFDDLKRFKPTVLNAPPAIVESLLRVIRTSADVASVTGGHLKKIMCAGAKVDDEVVLKLNDYGISVLTAYGLTECSPCVSLSRDLFWKRGSAGKVLDCCEVTIIDGEICVRGENVMIGYYGDEDATNEVLIDGLLRTGDLGYVDADGFLFVTGRKNDLLVFEDGKKIFLDEIEAIVCRVKGVMDSIARPEEHGAKAMFSVGYLPDDNADSAKIEALIKSALSDEGILARLKELHQLDDAPERTSLGKVRRIKTCV